MKYFMIPYLSLILWYTLSRQSHVLWYIFLKITGCSNWNVYLLQLCLPALDIYLQNLHIQFYTWLLLPAALSQAIHFFLVPHTEARCYPKKGDHITLWLQLFFASYFASEKGKKILKMTLPQLSIFSPTFIP